MADDGFDMFGSDDEEEEDAIREEQGGDDTTKHEQEAMALFLSTFFLKKNPQVKLKERVVGIFDPNGRPISAFEKRGFSLISLTNNGSDDGVPSSALQLDAVVVLVSDGPPLDRSIVLGNLLPGGVLIIPKESTFVNDKDFLPATPIEQSNNFISRAKLFVHAHASTCPWLPSSFSHTSEKEHLQKATVALSAYESQSSKMTETSQKRAVDSLRDYGYVVIRNLLDTNECQKWGSAVLESVHMAAERLMRDEKVNILEPQNSEQEPQSYREVRPKKYKLIYVERVPFHEKAGGTAFFHGSHNLKFTAEHCGSSNDYSNVFPYLVRPSLTLGDVVLFDCRILHFGLANTSESIERVLLYSNTTQTWFTDPKNWEDQRAIFEDL